LDLRRRRAGGPVLRDDARRSLRDTTRILGRCRHRPVCLAGIGRKYRIYHLGERMVSRRQSAFGREHSIDRNGRKRKQDEMVLKRRFLPLAFVLVAMPAAWADAQPVTVKKILQTRTTAAGQPLKVPPNPELIVTTYEIAPDTTLSLHKPPYARYAYVLDGEITVYASQGRRFHYKKGDVIVEVIDQWHTGKTGSSPVKLRVFDQVPPGTPTTVLWEPDHKH